MKMLKFVVLLVALAALGLTARAQYAQDSYTAGATVTAGTLVKINTSNQAVPATTSDTTVPVFIAINGGTSGTVIYVAKAGQTNCPIDATNASFSTQPIYVTNSTTTATDCHASSTAPSAGVYVIGILAAASTTSASNSPVDVGGFFQPGSGGGAVSSVSNSDGTETISPTTGAVVSSVNTAHAFTWSAANIFSAAGAASTPGLSVTGAPYTGGSTTTNFPQFYINDGTGPTTFSANGTEFGINMPSGFTGNAFDLHANGGASLASIDHLGNLTVASCTGCGGGGSSTLNGITAATAAQTGIQNAGFGINWEWNALSSSNTIGLEIQETTASTTGTPALLDVVTPASSNTIALNVSCGSGTANKCFNVTQSGGGSFYIDGNGTPNFGSSMDCDNGTGTPNSCNFIQGSNADWLFRDSSNSIHGAILSNVASDQGVGVLYTNNSTGTTNFLLACLTSTGQVVKCAASATSGVIGIVQEGGGTSGSARLLTHLGDVATCTFDGAITQDDYVQTSSTAGDCHDAGSTRPASNEIIGRVVSATNASAGNYLVHLTLEGQ